MILKDYVKVERAFERSNHMDFKELVKARHSVRQFTDVAIDGEKRAVLDEMAKDINDESGLKMEW